jgi:DnaJ homolog subfamily A member 5
LDKEEETPAREAGGDYARMPSFGDSKSDPKSVVRRFYTIWMGFSTTKTFSWKDQWKYSDAPDRRVKRAMEKENKRLRDAGRREFNDAVKVIFPLHSAASFLTLQSLVMFIRKRDPRYVKETIDEAKLQASLLAASQSQAAKAKANFQETLKQFETQDWMRVDEGEDEGGESEETEVEEEFECVACRKTYKNERYLCLRRVCTDGLGNLMPISREKNMSRLSMHYEKQ